MKGFWNSKFGRFLLRIKRFFESRLGVGILGVISVVAGGFIAFALVYPIVVSTNPGIICSKTILDMRDRVLAEGKEYSGMGDGAIVNLNRAISTTSEGTTYYYAVSTFQRACDQYAVEFVTETSVGKAQFSFHSNPDHLSPPIKLEKCYFLYAVNFENNPLDPSKKAEISDIGMEWGYDGTLFEDRTDHTRFPASLWEECNARMQTFMQETPKILEQFNIIDTYALIDGYIDQYRAFTQTARLPAINIILSLIFTPVVSFFFVEWTNLLLRDKQFKLVSRGILERSSTSTASALSIPSSTIETASEEEEHKTGKIEETDAIALRSNRFESFLQERNIRPVFGEWVIRGAGLFLLFVGTVLVWLSSYSSSHSLGGVGWEIFRAAEPQYESIVGTANVVLTIALVGIIAETRRNLHITSAIFFILALTWYTVITSVLVSLDLAIRAGPSALVDLIAMFLPGNIFINIGIFTFIGFFLFSDPPRYFINRKVFRALCVIPLGIAALSVTFTALTTLQFMIPPYWLRPMLLDRSFDSLIIGIVYEFVAFAFRATLTKKHKTENIDELLERPSIQFAKNFILCGLIAFYVIAFYAIPTVRQGTVSSGPNTFIYILIPLFLFYKPAGRHHRAISDAIYYALYASVLLLPRLTSVIEGIVGGF